MGRPFVGVKAALLLGLMATALVAACDASSASLGRQLFEGEAALVARIAGHDHVLPAQASRCVNCHEIGASPSKPPAAAGLSAGKFALSSPALTGERSRRGGPPSRFDEASLCRLLRTGLDPASVLIPQSMPRYEIDAAQCTALWAYLGAAGAR